MNSRRNRQILFALALGCYRARYSTRRRAVIIFCLNRPAEVIAAALIKWTRNGGEARENAESVSRKARREADSFRFFPRGRNYVDAPSRLFWPALLPGAPVSPPSESDSKRVSTMNRLLLRRARRPNDHDDPFRGGNARREFYGRNFRHFADSFLTSKRGPLF